MNENLFLLNKDKITVGVLSNRMPFSLPFYDDLQERSLDDLTDTLTLSIPANHTLSEEVTVDKYILYPTFDGGHKLYKIKELTETSDDNGSTKEIYAEISAQDDLIKDVVRPASFASATLEEVVSYILQGTDWRVGQVEDFGIREYKLDDFTNPLEALVTAVKAYGGELEYEYNLLPNSSVISSQEVSVYHQVGQDTGLFFTHGKDVKGVERIEDTSKLVTALVGVGKASDGGSSMSFADYKGELPEGFERGADWIGSVKAVENYSDGEHIFGVFKDDNAQSPSELFRNTLEAVKTNSRPLMTYKVTLVLLEKLTGYEHMLVRIGDTIAVQDETVTPALYVKARIRKLSRSITNPSNDGVELGDYIPVTPPATQRLADLQAKIRSKEETWNKAEEIPSIKEKLNVPMRYIRLSGDGNNHNSGTHVVELGAYTTSGDNVAQGKQVTAGNTDATNLQFITNGVLNTTEFASLGNNQETQWAMLDLGQVYRDISHLKVWMYWYESGREYNYKVQVSEDAINWVSLYDYELDGTYTASSGGFEIYASHHRAIYSNTSELRQAVEILSMKADTDTVETISQRLTSAETAISSDSIISTVTSSQEFADVLADKADASALDNMADAETVANLQNELATVYAKKTDITVTAEDVNMMFQSAGGVNLVKNSVGFAGKDFWRVTGLVDTEQPPELEQKGAGSGFYLKGGSIYQSVTVKGGKYTVSAIVKKSSTGTGYLKVTYDNAKVKHITFPSGKAMDFEVVSFVLDIEGSKLDLELQGTADSGLIVTSLMVNVGSLPLQWTHAMGEIYSTDIQFNQNGIIVKSSQYDGYTSITPEEFKGYYNTSGVKGEYEEVFSLNKDTTLINKLDAKQEINMSPMKIVPIKTDTLNGWAFVANDE